MKKLFAGMSAVAISLTQMGSVFAAYSDVPAGVWYEDAVAAFTDAGYLDSTQTRFRGNDTANRAEFIKLVVELNGGILSTPPAVPSFDDVKPGAWYYGYMEEAGKEGWVKGDGNCYGSHPCYARPAANINRAEAAALIVRAFNLESTGDASAFVDVPSGQWYTDAVQTAADHCVLQGDDTTGRARPADNMNRAEMVVMLHRVDQGLSFGVDCGVEENAEPAIEDVVPTSETTLEVEFNVAVDETAAVDAAKYAVSGDADIDVESVSSINSSTVELTLAEATTAGDSYTLSVEDMETADGDTFSDTMDFEGYTEIVKGDGILEVSVASTNPNGDTVPQGAIGVVMLSVDLTASCDDAVVIEDLTILHEGFGAVSNISGVYASIDGGRVTRERSIDSQDQTATLRFTEPLTIAACKTKTVDIVADFATSLTTGSEHNLTLELPSDFQSNAKDVEGNFPMRGETFTVAAVTSGQVTVTYRSVTPSDVDVGKMETVLGKFEVSTDSVEDQTLYSVTLEQAGTASDGDVTNIHIRRTDGTVLTGKVAQTVGDYATLVFDPPFTVLEGDRITLEVVGDVVGGAAENVIFQLEETSDLFAVGSLYGYGVNGQLYGSRVASSGTASTVTISAGQFTVEIDGPSQQTYTTESSDAVLAKIIMTPGEEEVDVKDFFVAIKGTTSTGGTLLNGSTTYDYVHEVLEGVELRDTKSGQSVAGTRITTTAGTDYDNTPSTYQIYRFDDFLVKKQSTWELRVDFITAAAVDGDRFKVLVCTTTGTETCTFGGLVAASTAYNIDAEGLSSGDAITDIRPSNTTVTGVDHLIAAANLTVAMRSIGTSDYAVRNTKNVTLLRFDATAGSAEDILFTSAVFASDSGSLLNAQNYALWVDSDGDNTVDTVLQKGVASASSKITFNDLAGGGYVIPSNETIVFEVHADMASSLTNYDLQLSFDGTNDEASLSAEEADGGSTIATTDMTLTEVTGKVYVLVNQGDLFISQAAVATPSRQLLGGVLGDSVLRVQLRAQYEDINVKSFQISSSGAAAASLVDRLELYKVGETTPFATANTAGTTCGDKTTMTANDSGDVVYCAQMNSSQLVVPRGTTLDILVRPRIKNDESGAASSSGGLLFWTGTGAVAAEGVQSSNQLTFNDEDAVSDGEIIFGRDSLGANALISGNKNDVVLSKITSIVNASPDADGTTIPTGVSPIGQFKFTAATNTNTKDGTNKATLSGVIFNVAATNVDFDGSLFKLYNKADASTKQSCTINGSATTSGSLLVECKGLIASTVNTQISSGDSVTFVLEGSVQDPNTATNSVLQVSLQNFASRSNQGYSSTTSHIDWEDKDSATTLVDFKWVESTETVVKSTSYRGQ